MENTIKIINTDACCIVCEYFVENKLIAINTKRFNNKPCPKCNNNLLFWEKL